MEETGISYEEATQLASEMILGTGKLLTTGGFTPAALMRRVAVPGGITAEGLRMMEHELDGVFLTSSYAPHTLNMMKNWKKVRIKLYGHETNPAK